VVDVIGQALQSGATAVQVRDKGRGAGDTLALTRQLRVLTRSHEALLLVNDRFDLALAAGADGVHLGPEDLPVAAVRARVPADFLIGYSTDVPEDAIRAEREGADYLGVGAVFETVHKADAGVPIGPAGLARIAGAVSIPVVGIGGISAGRLPALSGTGAAGVAVIGAIMAAPDPGAATLELARGIRNLATGGPRTGRP